MLHEGGEISSWSVQDVKNWWKAELPQDCSEYLKPVVSDLWLNGEDLYDLDAEMLAELEVPKRQIIQILKAVSLLRNPSGEQRRGSSSIEIDVINSIHRYEMGKVQSNGPKAYRAHGDWSDSISKLERSNSFAEKLRRKRFLTDPYARRNHCENPEFGHQKKKIPMTEQAVAVVKQHEQDAYSDSGSPSRKEKVEESAPSEVNLEHKVCIRRLETSESFV